MTGAEAEAVEPDRYEVLKGIWALAGLPVSELPETDLPAPADVLSSSFRVGLAAQTSVAAAASAASAIYFARSGARQAVSVDRNAAERECTGYFQLDGDIPTAWEKFSGLYPTADGYVRIHANFEHHRDGALDLLGLGDAQQTSREDVAEALAGWSAAEFETAGAARGLVVAMVRSFEQWDEHPQALALTNKPVIRMSRIDGAEPDALPALKRGQRPLSGVRVLDLTRILAGPICGRTLAAYGAEVLLVNSPRLPNIAAIVDTSRGKRSCHLDLTLAADRAQLAALAADAQVFVQGYRPGALPGLGFSAADVARIRPGIVYVSLSAYGNEGPWRARRGFDSLVQTATGFNHAEMRAAGANQPRSLPVQILDFASGFLMAFGAQAALLRQAREGGSWHVEVSLAGTARWLRTLGRRPGKLETVPLDLEPYLAAYPCTSGTLRGLPHAAVFSRTGARWDTASAPPGTHPPRWAGKPSAPL